MNYAVKSSYLLSFLESVPEVTAKLKEPTAKEKKFDDVVEQAKEATVLVLVYTTFSDLNKTQAEKERAKTGPTISLRPTPKPRLVYAPPPALPPGVSQGGGYPGSVTVAVGDRPYYVHGAGYYQGRTYYVWKPGQWGALNGQRVWIHGHYVARGY